MRGPGRQAAAAGGGSSQRSACVRRTLDELRLGEAADFLVALDLVAAVGAAGAVVLDCVVPLEARVGRCGALNETVSQPTGGSRGAGSLARALMLARSARACGVEAGKRESGQWEAAAAAAGLGKRTGRTEQREHGDEQQCQTREDGGRRGHCGWRCTLSTQPQQEGSPALVLSLVRSCHWSLTNFC